MKHLTRYILLLLVFTSLFSCKKFLDIKPDQQLINDSAMTTVKDLRAVLDGAYDGLQSSIVAGGDVTAFSDLMSDDFEVLPNKLSNFGTSEIYNGQTSVQINALRDMWKQNYGVINRVNNVIRTIDNAAITGAEFDNNKNRFKGESLFIRAYCHYNLLQLFALPYDVNNKGGNTQLGVVIRTEPTLSGPEGLSKARSTVEECYAAIINDLIEASNLLNTAGQQTSVDRVSAMAARAMLARVNFVTGNYSAAASVANEVINSNNFKLANEDGKDSTKIVKMYVATGNSVVNYNGKPEVIWQLVNTSEDNSGSLFGYYSTNSYMRIKNDIINSIDTLDDRIVRNTSGGTVSGQSTLSEFFSSDLWYVSKYNKVTGVSFNSNVVMLRLSEMYLIKAEAAALAANAVNSEALDAFNKLKLRNYGIGSYTPETTTDLNDFLSKIRFQRRVELIGEFGDRYAQLRRLGLPLRDGSTNYAKYLFKIPQEEMASNELMVQNP
jgi:hypothetical protein